MYLGRVIGTVVSTTKDESLVGFKLLVVSKLNETLQTTETSDIVVDSGGAGVGEVVLVSKGSSARYVLNKPNSPIDSAVVGIVDSVEVDDV